MIVVIFASFTEVASDLNFCSFINYNFFCTNNSCFVNGGDIIRKMMMMSYNLNESKNILNKLVALHIYAVAEAYLHRKITVRTSLLLKYPFFEA